MIKHMKAFIFILLAIISINLATVNVSAGHPPDTEGYYCDGNVLWRDAPYFDPSEEGTHELVQDCGSDRVCTTLNHPEYQNGYAECKPKSVNSGTTSNSNTN